VLASTVAVLTVVLVAAVRQPQQEQVPGERRGDRGTP
jgi:hypothetical protein